MYGDSYVRTNTVLNKMKMHTTTIIQFKDNIAFSSSDALLHLDNTLFPCFCLKSLVFHCWYVWKLSYEQ